MNLFVVLLALILLAAVVLAVELLRTGRTGESRGYAELWADVSERRDYVPVDRLFEQSDFEMLAERPILAKRLRRRRRRVTRLALRQLRRDFLNAWALCRILSPISPDPGLAVRLAGHWLTFHSIYGAVMLHTSLGMTPQAAADPSQLIQAVRALQSGAAELIHAQQKLGLSATAA